MSGKGRVGTWRKKDQKTPNPLIKFTVSRELYSMIEAKINKMEVDRRGMAEIGRELFRAWAEKK